MSGTSVVQNSVHGIAVTSNNIYALDSAFSEANIIPHSNLLNVAREKVEKRKKE